MIVGLHWREYTVSETTEIIEHMGFETIRTYYYAEKDNAGIHLIVSILNKIIYSYPPFRPTQVVIGKKVTVPQYDFWLTDANS